MTVMAEALSRAGYRKPEDAAARLRRMMREAIAAGGGRAEPSIDHFTAALARADEAALLWEMFAAVRRPVIAALFSEILSEMRGAQPPRDADDTAGTASPQGPLQHAVSSATNAAAGAVPRAPEGRSQNAPAAAPIRPPLRVDYAARERIARLSILQTFRRVGGMPLAEVTGGEARQWLRSHERDGRFVRLVSDQVPDEIRIGAMIPEEEADRLYRLAEEAANG